MMMENKMGLDDDGERLQEDSYTTSVQMCVNTHALYLILDAVRYHMSNTGVQLG